MGRRISPSPAFSFVEKVRYPTTTSSASRVVRSPSPPKVGRYNFHFLVPPRLCRGGGPSNEMRWWWGFLLQVLRLIHNLPAHHGQQHLGAADLFRFDLEQIAIKHDQVGKLAGFQRTGLLVLPQAVGRIER